MMKTLENPEELIEADFKEIQKLLEKKYKKEYTRSYIRKVCKGTRSNTIILAMAEDYMNLCNEAWEKMTLLAAS